MNYLSAQDVQGLLHIGRDKAYQIMRSCPCLVIGGVRRVSKRDLEAFIFTNTEQPSGSGDNNKGRIKQKHQKTHKNSRTAELFEPDGRLKRRR